MPKMTTRGGSVASCLSRSTSSDSELNLKLLAMYKTPPRPSQNSFQASVSSIKKDFSFSTDMCCRICHDSDCEEKLLTVCRCLGSIKYIHHSCLLTWISRSGNLSCELCKFDYNVTRTRRKRLSEWNFPAVGIQGWLHLVLFFAFFAMLMTSLTWVVWSQTSNSSAAIFERTSAEIKYAYMLNGIFIMTAIIGISFDSFRQARKYFQRSLALNQELAIEEYITEEDSVFDKKHKETFTSDKLFEADLSQDQKGELGTAYRELRCSESSNCKCYGHSFTSLNGVLDYSGTMDRGVVEYRSTNPGYMPLTHRNSLPESREGSVFIEIDLSEDASRSTLLTDISQNFDCPKSFESLEELTETCI